MLAWCEQNNFAHVKRYNRHKNRGTWFNNSLKRSYEIDDFLMKKLQRLNNVKKVNTVGDLTLSNHKQKKIILVRKWRKYNRNERKKQVPKFRWVRLDDEVIASQYRRRVEDLLEEYDETEDADITSLKNNTNIVIKAAKKVCGREEKKIEYPWMMGKGDEVQ